MLTIVSGINYEARSLILKIFEAGGLKVVKDSLTSEGGVGLNIFFEYEKINLIKDHPSYRYDDENIVINITSFLLKQLSLDYKYNLLLIEKPVKEKFLSNGLSFDIFNQKHHDTVDLMRKRFIAEHKISLINWLKHKPNFNVFVVNIDLLISNPVEMINKINQELNLNLDFGKCISKLFPDPRIEKKLQINVV